MSAVPHLRRRIVTANRTVAWQPGTAKQDVAAPQFAKGSGVTHRQLAAVAALLRKKGFITVR